jgi:hypothetical protein
MRINALTGIENIWLQVIYVIIPGLTLMILKGFFSQGTNMFRQLSTTDKRHKDEPARLYLAKVDISVKIPLIKKKWSYLIP